MEQMYELKLEVTRDELEEMQAFMSGVDGYYIPYGSKAARLYDLITTQISDLLEGKAPAVRNDGAISWWTTVTTDAKPTELSMEQKLAGRKEVKRLISLAESGAIGWFTGTPMGYFESRKVTCIPDKTYEQQTYEEKQLGGMELTVLWSCPTNYAGLGDNATKLYSQLEQRPVKFYLYTTTFRGELEYEEGMRLMEAADEWMQKRQALNV